MQHSTIETEARQARALMRKQLDTMTSAELRAEYANATREQNLFNPVSQAIRLECRHIATKRGIDLTPART